MVYYLQLECNEQTAVPSGEILKFDTGIALSHTNPTVNADFSLNEDGSINIYSPGTYAVYWYVAGMTGFSTDGQFYQLKKMNKEQDDNHHWDDPGVGATNHIKVSSSPGFAIVNVTSDEIRYFGPATIALFNTADEEIELTFFEPKAGIMVFGLDFTRIQGQLTTIEQQITDLFQQLLAIENFVELSDVDHFFSLDPHLAGLGVSVIHSGYTYNFWGTGTLSSVQNLAPSDPYYLLTSAQYAPLQLYQGDPTIGTLWIELPDRSIYSIPVRFDSTGIYFYPLHPPLPASLPTGTTFKFTQALILVPPAPPAPQA